MHFLTGWSLNSLAKNIFFLIFPEQLKVEYFLTIRNVKHFKNEIHT